MGIFYGFMFHEEEELIHYGTPRHSGRYPWGSGQNPNQRGNKDFLAYVSDLKKQGLTERDIARDLGYESTTQLRARVSMAKTAKRQEDQAQVMRLRDKGMSNVAISQRLGIPESSVRALQNPMLKERLSELEVTAGFLKDQVKDGSYLDIGAGTENWRGVSKVKLDTAVAMLKEQGYQVYNIRTPQQFGKGMTTVKVLAKPGTEWADVARNKTNIKTVAAYGDGKGNPLAIETPIQVSSKRIGVKFGGEGGEKADGVIYVRPGVEDLSMGSSRYLQVRIGVDGTHYLKGMAMYKDDLPEGIDLQFNTSKPRTANKLDVMKPIEGDPDNPFKAVVTQRHYIDGQGKRHLSPMNIVYEEGDWNDWRPTLSSQILSKQDTRLAKRQLDMALTDRELELGRIRALTNPVIKQKLLTMYADEADSAAVHLKAAAMPRQRTHVILPFPGMKEGDVYAPGFNDGERIVLIRHPHGGTFEIPELRVNNKFAPARKVLGAGAAGVMHPAVDAIGIHPKVAKRLSGADFDGDAVLVIPNPRHEIRTSSPLKGLQDFDPSKEYPSYPGMKVLKGRAKQQQMGDVSNLITDMTIKGASHDEIAKAVRHSMVVIDAEKHELDVGRSYKENGIKELKLKYQGKGPTGKPAGASTIISRAGSQVRIPQRRPLPARKGGPIEPGTGRRQYEPTGRTYVNKSGERVPLLVRSKRLAEEEDARNLISTENLRIEQIYAAHSNSLKALANMARLESLSTGKIHYSPASSRTYKPEVDRLNAALNKALKNAPLERQAQIITNAMVAARIHDNPALKDDPDALKKVRAKELLRARTRVGAGKDQIVIEPREWEAIQAGAFSTNKLRQIINNSDVDRVKELATPRAATVMTPAKMAIARARLASGYTQAEVAASLDISVQTLNSALLREGD